MSDYAEAQRAVMEARCPDYRRDDGSQECDGPDGCAECMDAILAAVRASAIREAVERMTDQEMDELAGAIEAASYEKDGLATMRALILGALTRREETAT